MKKLLAAMMGMLLMSLGLSATAFAAEPNDAKVLVDQAQITLRDFDRAPEASWYRQTLRDAKGVLVVPSLVKAGFILGGSGGKGVYFTREGKSGLCKGPAFYNVGSVTFGLQIGIEKAEVVILAMSDEAVKAMMSPQFKLGGDIGIAAGPVGGGAAGQVGLPASAFVSFAMAKGAYAGLNLEGAIVASSGDYNAKYYGKSLSSEDILARGGSSEAGGLCAMVERPRHEKY